MNEQIMTFMKVCDSDQNTEVMLKFSNQAAVVSPYGASLRQNSVNSKEKVWNAIWGYQADLERSASAASLSQYHRSGVNHF